MKRTQSSHLQTVFGEADEGDEYDFDINYSHSHKSESKYKSNKPSSECSSGDDAAKHKSLASTGALSMQSNPRYNIMEHAQELLNRYNQAAGKDDPSHIR